jgi:hypothetical protein
VRTPSGYRELMAPPVATGSTLQVDLIGAFTRRIDSPTLLRSAYGSAIVDNGPVPGVDG